MTAWDEYTPTAADPWDAKKAGHLLRRAAFGPGADTLAKAVADGPKKAVDDLLRGGPANAEFDRTSDYMAQERALPAGSPGNLLAAWWVYRMLHSPHPLREKLTLFWHNHFATSIAKVQNVRHMLGQYRLLHEYALGDFRAMLTKMAADPAMMIWLDTIGSVKGKPNENYARELMELFALGIGNYTEADVREAARAFTGYTFKNGKPKFDAGKHDDGAKTVFGKTGDYGADDVTELCLKHPACPKFIVRKLYSFLVSDAESPTDELIAPLAEQYQKSGFDTGTVVGVILRSRHFYSAAAYRQKVKSPVEFAVGIVRGLNGTVGPLNLASALEPLGQILFAPPSVKGWDGGPAWLNAQTLLARQNLALALTSTEDSRFGRRCDPAAVLAAKTVTDDAAAVDFLLDVFLQNDVPAAAKRGLVEYLAGAKAGFPPYWTAEDVRSHRHRTLARLVTALPEFQLN